MKALVIDGYGLEKVRVTEVPDPEPGPGEVVVRLKAAALNHLDLWTAKGSLNIPHEFPHVLGADGAGTIEKLGPGVDEVDTGGRVVINPGLSCGKCELCRRGEQSICTTFKLLGEHVPGTFAERVVVPARNLFPIPQHLTFAEGAALGVTSITAYRMLFTRGGLRPGEWVLITGVGGGLGLSLLQLAAPVAGRILVTSSTREKIERAHRAGSRRWRQLQVQGCNAMGTREDVQARRRSRRRLGRGPRVVERRRHASKGGQARHVGCNRGTNVRTRCPQGLLEPTIDHRFDHGLGRRRRRHVADGAGKRHQTDYRQELSLREGGLRAREARRQRPVRKDRSRNRLVLAIVETIASM